ncbi:MAG: hypothetical protein K2Q03_03875 [Sphingobacteriaceae bacterium]|nr:hypothetical protein [Sphingobacteriaceae bacterium]
MSELTRFFEDRQNDVDIFFTHLDSLSIDTNTSNLELHKILKSQCILMLYNVIEGTVNQGIQLIFDKVTNSNVSHDNVSEKIQIIWYKHHEDFNKHVDDSMKMIACFKDKFLSNLVLNLTEFRKVNPSYFGAGTLDSKKIKSILKKKFDIDLLYVENVLESIKNNRNNLAHGEASYLECCHEITFAVLTEWKDKTIDYMQKYINTINDYVDNKKFITNNVTS